MCDEYAVLNDDSIGYRLPTYFISSQRQIEQLERHGFSEVAVINHDGALVGGDEVSREPWLYYAAVRRPPEA